MKENFNKLPNKSKMKNLKEDKLQKLQIKKLENWKA